ncbi:MAG: hypothetical protein Q9N02_05085, partial [Ghiorsea sp.]|nr:hypothetical protein [Ghiorsea sp.]
MQRYLQAKFRRNKHPESRLWETAEGEHWMRLMVIAATYHFGLGCGVGAGKLSDFFHMVRIEGHVGVSESSVQELLRNIEAQLPEFQKLCEESATKKPRQVVAAMDETFFGKFMIMVVIDLQSGYLLLEDIADDRRYDTWLSKIIPRLESLGVDVTHAISDRAKALIKLAVKGFGCESGADTFHAQYDISKWLARPFSRMVKHAKNSLEKLDILDKKEEKEAIKDLESCQQGQSDYRKEMQGISEDIHPFSLENNQVNTVNQVEDQLENRAVRIAELAERHGLNDNKNTVQKFRNQIKALAVSINFWWLFVHTTLRDLGSNEETNAWVIEKLLPVVYWHHQKQRTQNSVSRDKYQQAWERASQALKGDP